MSDPFVAEIRMFSGGFVPSNWAKCNGQFTPNKQNLALFSVIGNTYGHQSPDLFALPDLQGRVPVGASDYDNRPVGYTSGSPTIELLEVETPSHTHAILAYGGDLADVNTPGPGVILGATSGLNLYGPTADTTMNAAVLSEVGAGKPHNNLSPYLVVNFIIALQGTFPSRP
jgi:microcystin-dependent protein